MANPEITIARALAAAARTEGGVFLQQEDGRTTLRRYAALEADASRVAGGLRERVAPGERVAIVLADPDAFLQAFLGAALGGFVPVPFAPPASLGSGLERLHRQLGLVAPALLVTTHGLRDALAGPVAPGAIVVLDELRAAAPERAAAATAPEALVLVSDESVRSLDAAELAGALATLRGRDAMGLQEGDVVATLLPLSHPAAILSAVLLPLLEGASLLVLHPLVLLRAPSETLRQLSTFRAAACLLPEPALLQIARRIAVPDLAGIHLRGLRVLAHGSKVPAAPVLAQVGLLLGAAGLDERALVAGGRVSRLSDEVMMRGSAEAPPSAAKDAATSRTGGAPRVRLSGSLFTQPEARQLGGSAGFRAALSRAFGWGR